jgi:hypothetical protein
MQDAGPILTSTLSKSHETVPLSLSKDGRFVTKIFIILAEIEECRIQGQF